MDGIGMGWLSSGEVMLRAPTVLIIVILILIITKRVTCQTISEGGLLEELTQEKPDAW